jgi:hypothetical protein
MHHTVDIALLTITSVACVTIGRPMIATALGLFCLFVYMR